MNLRPPRPSKQKVIEKKSQLVAIKDFPGSRDLSSRVTGSHVLRDSPATYQAVLDDLKDGEYNVSEIASRHGLDWRTIDAIRRNNGFSKDTEKIKQRGRWAAITERGTDQLLDELPNIHGKELAVVVAIASDKLALADGDPTSITAVQHTIEYTPDADYLAQLKAKRAAQAVVIDVSPLPNTPIPAIRQANQDGSEAKPDAS